MCSPASEPDFPTTDAQERAGDDPTDAGANWGEPDEPDVTKDTPEDAVSDATGPGGLSDFGEPCEEDLDCYSGLCAEHMGDTVCTKTCESECPAGWSCEQVVLGGGDPIYLCVSLFERLNQFTTKSVDVRPLRTVQKIRAERRAARRRQRELRA